MKPTEGSPDPRAPAGSVAPPAAATPGPAAVSERLKHLSEELRCLVCQNQTLADSNADLAVDLRRQVETMIIGGRSDNEIRDYMVARYGDFVLYKPPVQRNTWLLWFGPFALLAAGGLMGWWVQRRSRVQATQTPGSAPGQAPATSGGDPPQATPALPCQTAAQRDRARALLER